MTRFTHYHWYRSSAPKQVDDPRHSSHSMLFLYFAEQFWVCSKTEQKVQSSQIPAVPDIYTTPIPLSRSRTRMIHLLQLMSLHHYYPNPKGHLFIPFRRHNMLPMNPYLLKVVCAGFCHLQPKASSFTNESTPSSRLTSTILLSPTLHSGFTFLFNHSWILFH